MMSEGTHLARPRTSPTHLVCIVCSQRFPVTPGQYGQRVQSCSPECRSELRRRENSRPGRRRRVSKRPWNEGRCDECGQPYRWQKRYARRFCSNKCRTAWFGRLTPTGAKNPYWKGGQGPSYYGESWRSAKRLAISRDRGACADCGRGKDELGELPCVHHLIPFRVFGTDRHEEANVLSNLICLCRSCHLKREWAEYGRGGLSVPVAAEIGGPDGPS